MQTGKFGARFFDRHGVQILMWALVAEMLASPLADSHPRVGALLGLTVLLMVLAGIGRIANRTIVRWTVFPIAAIWMITRIFEAFGNRRDSYANLSPIFGLLLSCSILWAIFDHFTYGFRDRRNAIPEAFISYLVIATGFSQIYWILNRFVDHAFNQVIPYTQNGTFLYFSMVTITSVGYGGIVPVNPYVRITAALESMAGIFFVAVVVARLVSTYNPNRANQAPNADSAAQETASRQDSRLEFRDVPALGTYPPSYEVRAGQEVDNKATQPVQPVFNEE
jgi:phosphate/sulfate permease